MWDALISFAALLALCAGLAALPGLDSAAAPLVGVSASVLWFLACGVFGGLPWAGPVWLAVGALALGAGLFMQKTALLKKLLTPGFLLFAAGGLVLLVYFAIRQPVFSQWDEFSFSGSAAKVMVVDQSLYVRTITNYTWPSAEYPAMALLSYMGQFLGEGFSDWKVYWAYGLLYFACVAAMLIPFGLRRWRVAVPLAVGGLMLPFCFSILYHTVNLSYGWLSSYTDIPVGMLFGGALVLYYALRRAQSGALWAVLPPLGMLAVMKQLALPIALVAAGVMAADTLIFGGRWSASIKLSKKGKKIRKWQQGLKRLLWAAAYFIAVLAPYQLWGLYVARAELGVGPSNMTPGAALGAAVGEVAAGQLTQRPAAAAGLMLDELLGRVPDGAGGWQYGVINMSMLGSGLVTVLFCAGLFALAVGLASGRRLKWRAALAGALALGGLCGFLFQLFVVYGYFYRGSEIVFDFGRYLGSYLAGFLMLGLFWLALAGWGGALRSRLARAGVLAVACLLCLRFSALARPGTTVLDYPTTAYTQQRARRADAETVASAAGPAARIFFICQTGNGQEWFEYAQYLYPTILDYSILGGRGFNPANEGERPQDIAAYLEATGCTHIWVTGADGGFAESYAALFEDGLASWQGQPTLYERGPNGLYAPVAAAE